MIIFRRDRSTDRWGGVLVYVKDSLSVSRRHDLEVNGIESIWLEVRVKKKPILIGTFYRSPGSPVSYLSQIQDSIGLAVDTGIKDIVVTGYLNQNYL